MRDDPYKPWYTKIETKAAMTLISKGCPLMDYRILVDSCVDKQTPDAEEVSRIPFTVHIDGASFVDEGSQVTSQLNRINFIAKSIRTSCPAPGDFIDALDGSLKAFIVTISSQLSGAHAAAIAARDQIMDKFKGACDIHVFDSESASAGETLVLMKLQQLIGENLSVPNIAEQMTKYVDGLRTLFVLNSLDTLVANGRVKPIEGFALKALKICPIMGDDGHGRIELKALARGKAKAFAKLIDMIGDSKFDLRERVLGITHVNTLEVAQDLKARIEERYKFKEVVIFEASGLSSVYASDGGIVIAY